LLPAWPSKFAPAMRKGKEKVFQTIARADTPEEVNYYRHGGILPYVLAADAVARLFEAQASEPGDSKRQLLKPARL
jgi:hypothetical protein